MMPARLHMAKVLLDENFDRPLMDRPAAPVAESPKKWSIDAAASPLVLAPHGRTDICRKTGYGFAAGSGHPLFGEAAGNLGGRREL